MQEMAFPGIFMILIMLLVYGLLLFGIIYTLFFMRKKLMLDEQRNRQMEQLIRLLEKKE
ncbi:hypothetical protein [Brevibacillus sp. SYSU BS000544]|uniref:hypothetical protein n=1 Tax=Brevibacillus sp. SYSU BS000544 TaxID=3416443 RepID=UPI003CE5002B